MPYTIYIYVYTRQLDVSFIASDSCYTTVLFMTPKPRVLGHENGPEVGTNLKHKISVM